MDAIRFLTLENYATCKVASPPNEKILFHDHVVVVFIFELLAGYTVSTVFEERQFNPRLTLSEQKFVEFMRNLNLAYPKLIGKWFWLPVVLSCDIAWRCAWYSKR